MKGKEQEFEQLLQETFNQFEGNVPSDAWMNVQQGLQAQAAATSAASTATAAKASGLGLSKLAGLVIGAVTLAGSAGLYIALSDGSPQTSPAAALTTEVVTEQPTVAGQVIQEQGDKAIAENTALTTSNNPTAETALADQPSRSNSTQSTASTTDGGSKGFASAGTTTDNRQTDNKRQMANNAADQTNDRSAQDVKEKEDSKQKEFPVVDTELPPLVRPAIVANPIGGSGPLNVKFSINEDAHYGDRVWDFGDGSDWSNEGNPEHTYSKAGTYSARLMTWSEDGRKIEESITIKVAEPQEDPSTVSQAAPEIFIPNVFSPNHDGINDVVQGRFKHVKQVSFVVLSIDNRVVFRSEALDFQWTGRDMEGQDLPMGTYYYLLETQGTNGEQHRHKGSITLFRD